MSLKSSLILFQPVQEVRLPQTMGKALHALFLNMIKEVDAPLATRLHDLKGEKPFTVSPLRGPVIQEGQAFRLFPEETYSIRITSLDAALSEVMASLETTHFTCLEAEFEVCEIVHEALPWARAERFHDLYDRRHCKSSIRFSFLSPTTFRTFGNNLPLPLPALIFKGLCRQWQCYSTLRIDEEAALMDAIEKKVSLSRLRIESRMMDFGTYRQVGFVGDCTFRIAADCPATLSGWLNTLADFAFYAGIGYKTTMGMGQVRRIK